MSAKRIMARLREGYSGVELREVVLDRTREWEGNPKMPPYLRPQTLFDREHFEQYRGVFAKESTAPARTCEVCGKAGVWSPTIQGHGPWFCREHA